MMEENNLHQLIVEYESYIRLGNTILAETYKTDISPILAKRQQIIPAQGTIEANGGQLSFRFHGMGCLFDFHGTIVDFDYDFGDFVYRGFDPFKLKKFLDTFPATPLFLKDQQVFEQSLAELLSKGIIKEKNEGSLGTYKYQLSKH
jgi:hypothetical protein